MKYFEKYYKWVVAFIFAVAVIAVYKTFDNFSHITRAIGTVLKAFQPFVIAFVIAYLLNIPAKKLKKLFDKIKNKFVRNHSGALSILSVYLIALAVVVIILGALIPALYRNILDLYNNLPSYMTTVETKLSEFEIIKKLNLFGENDVDLMSSLNSVINSIDMAQFGKYAQGVFQATSGVLNMFIAIIASVYMLIDKERLQRKILNIFGLIFKESAVKAITGHAKRINDIFTNYIYSRLICSVIMAVACGVVLSVLKVKYALILGLFIGAMDMIPYFGSIISSVLSILITFITGGLWKTVWAAIALLLLQQIDGNLLGPKIMGNSLEVSPLLIIIAVSVGGALFGFLGMLLSVPVVAIVRAIGSEYVEVFEKKKNGGGTA